MKHFMGKLPEYFEMLVGAVLVVIVVQYALITGAVKPGHLVSGFFQLGSVAELCYCCLTD